MSRHPFRNSAFFATVTLLLAMAVGSARAGPAGREVNGSLCSRVSNCQADH